MWFSVHDPEVPDSVAEAEDEAARAEARAEAARARAARLREAAEAADTKPARSRPRWLRRPGRKAIAIPAAILLGCASLGASGYMLWQHRTIMHKRQLTPEFAAAARDGVTKLMSIDAHHAKEDIQGIIDASTGELRSQVEATSRVMIKQAEDAKVVSKGTVEAAAVQSVTDNSAVVLVAVKTDVTNPDNTKRPPALWRLSVNIDRDGNQLKMSKVEFLQ
jgi:Mce-associated membrane protein